jgi:hypothetical protein
MTDTKNEYRDPKSLRLHKLRKHFPAIDKEASDWIALVDSVAASGVLQPILITAEGLIVDGAWRWEAAKDWQFKEVPCQIVEDWMAGSIIHDTLLARKQMTRGAAMYLMIPIMKEVVMSAELRRLDNLKKGRKSAEIEVNPQCFSMLSNFTSETAQESVKNFCFRSGVSPVTFYKAKAVYLWLNEEDCAALKKLHQDLDIEVPAKDRLEALQDDLKSDFESALLTGEKNLWNVESGIKGRLSGGEHELPQQQLELFGDALTSLATRAERFESPAQAAPEIKKWIKALETEMVEHRGRPEEEFFERIRSVAATCMVTHATIQDFLKNQQRSAAAK